MKKWSKKPRNWLKKNRIYSAIVLMALALVPASIIGNISTAEAVEIIVLFGLFIVTAAYAKRTSDIAQATKEQAQATKEQAHVSVKMAEEMREQRYDTVRPVIDIYRDPADDDKLSEAFAATEGDASQGLSCILHNIGLGPAIDVCSFVQVQKNERRCWDFGTSAKDQKTDPKSLSVNREGDRNYVSVYYKDVFGRNFQSSREVKPTKEKTALEIGPLKTVLVKESKSK